MTVDFVGSRPHYWDHMAPIADELTARGAEWEVHMDYTRLNENRANPTVAAAWCDIDGARKQGRRRLILTEHGAGQCLAPDTPVLTADLRHVPVEDLRVGDELIGFAEDHVGPSARGRRHQRSYVTATQRIMQPCHRLHFSDGTTVVASDGHLWLTLNRGTWGWVPTANLQDAARWPSRSSKLLRLTEVWQEDMSHGAGYLAAAFDGEGHISQHEKGANRPGEYRLSVFFSQKPGLMLDRVTHLLAERRFKFALYENKASAVYVLRIKGGRAEILRFLGSIRPLRLLQNMNPLESGTIRGEKVQLLLSEPIGMQEVIGLETSSKTLVAAGLASHNSYGTRNRSYVGGQGRERLDLVLVPNEMAAARHRRFYRHHPPVTVVGSPRVDALRALPAKPCGYPPRIAVTWHWMCLVAKEAGSAWPVFGPAVMEELARMEQLGVIQLLGHAHPRIAHEIEPWYAEHGISVASGFDEVCEWADVLMVDNSSVLFEFAALDRPVIVVNSPAYRRNINHGLRFWECSDVGVQVDDPKYVPRAVMAALEDPLEVAERRREVVAQVFPYPNEAAVRAADAILALGG